MCNITREDKIKLINEWGKDLRFSIDIFRIFYKDNSLNEYGLKKGLTQEEVNLLPTPWLEKILYTEWLKDKQTIYNN